MTDNGLATTAHTLGNIHRAIIHSHAKDYDMNKSEALRDIIEQFAEMVAHFPRNPYQAETSTPRPDAALAGLAGDGEVG